MRMRRATLLLLAGGAVLAVLLAFSPFNIAATASAHARTARTAQTARDSAGSVSGVLTNGSHGNAPVANYLVTLQAVTDSKATDAATTKTDVTGHFNFKGLDTTGLIVYSVYARYEGGLFTTDPISFDSGAAQQVTLKIYETTTSNAGIRVASTTLLFSPPNQPKGLLPVGVLMTIVNNGNTAYVASTAPANGLPMNLLRFSLPPNAQNLTLGAGFSDAQAIQVDTGFGVTTTVPPGQTAFAFAYDVPYTGTHYTFQFKAEYPSDHVVVLIPPAIKTIALDFTPQPEITANGQQYQVLTREKVAANATFSFSFINLPLPGENPDLDFRQLVIVGAGLLLLLLVLLGLFVRRGNLAVVFGWVPASMFSSSRLNQRSRTARETERKRLLRALLALDERHAAGTLGEESYLRQRDQLRARLRSLLALEQAGTVKSRKTKPAVARQNGAAPQAVVEPTPEPVEVAHESPEAVEQQIPSGERS